jgi:hypothetical protein
VRCPGSNCLDGATLGVEADGRDGHSSTLLLHVSEAAFSSAWGLNQFACNITDYCGVMYIILDGAGNCGGLLF